MPPPPLCDTCVHSPPTLSLRLLSHLAGLLLLATQALLKILKIKATVNTYVYDAAYVNKPVKTTTRVGPQSTALGLAVKNNRKDIVEELITNGGANIDLGIRDKPVGKPVTFIGRSPLMLASSRG